MTRSRTQTAIDYGIWNVAGIARREAEARAANRPWIVNKLFEGLSNAIDTAILIASYVLFALWVSSVINYFN